MTHSSLRPKNYAHGLVSPTIQGTNLNSPRGNNNNDAICVNTRLSPVRHMVSGTLSIRTKVEQRRATSAISIERVVYVSGDLYPLINSFLCSLVRSLG